jgi:pilus assembly protein CpaE
MQYGPSGGAVRVVIASDAPQAVAELDKLAGYADQVSLVGFIRHPGELDEDLETLNPDLVLLYTGFGGLDTVTLAAELASRSAQLRVMVVVDPADISFITRLEDAGAATVGADASPTALVEAIRGAVALPPTPPADELPAPSWPGMAPPPAEQPAAPAVPVFELDAATLDAGSVAPPPRGDWPGVPAAAPAAPTTTRESEPEPAQPAPPRPVRRRTWGQARMAVVFSGKGGVGTSLIATNLAVALAADGERVALVDLDLQFGDLAAMLHLESHPTGIDVLAQQGEQVDGDFIEEVMATGPAGVRALLAPASPEFADLVNTASVRAILREMAREYDHIIVDTPSHLEERNLEAIELADQIVVVTSFNFAALKDTKITLKLLQSLGIQKDKICVVLNQTRARVSFQRGEVEDSLRFRVLTVLPFEPRVDDFIDSGRSIVTEEPKAEFSKQFRVLLDHILGNEGRPDTKETEGPHGHAARRRFSIGRS